MDGLIVIDKPASITSHDVVSRVRRLLKTRRVGHTGTLDPFATGVMVLLAGRATRLAQFLDRDNKEYEAVVRFGFETDTGDSTGKQKEERKSQKLPSVDEITAILPKFTGEMEQVPPMYSAKKIQGKKLYEHARKGIKVERKVQKVTIHELVLLGIPEVALTQPLETAKLRVSCSAGTYIRTLAADIGRSLGTAAHLAELRRTRSGRFNLSQSIMLDDLEKLAEPTECLLPISDAVSHLPALTMADERAAATTHGLSTRLDDARFADGEAVRMINGADHLLAVGVYEAAERSIRPKVVLV